MGIRYAVIAPEINRDLARPLEGDGTFCRMARYIVTAPADVDLAPHLDGPLIYLAGPVQGCDDWQADAIDTLGSLAPDLHIANPRARNFRGALDAHLDWERAYASRASVILCWLARENQHRCNRAFAGQTRFELGTWAARAQADQLRLVVGVDRAFSGRAYLTRRLALDFPHVPVCRSLRQACAAAAELATEPVSRPLVDRFVPRVVP